VPILPGGARSPPARPPVLPPGPAWATIDPGQLPLGNRWHGGGGSVVGGALSWACLAAVVGAAAAVLAARRLPGRPPALPALVALAAVGAAQLLPPLSTGGRGAALQGAATAVALTALAAGQLHLLRRRLATSAVRSWLDLATGVPGCLAVVWAIAAPLVAAVTGGGLLTAALLLTPLGLALLGVTFAVTSTALLRPVDRRMVLTAAVVAVLTTGEAGSVSAAAGQVGGDLVADAARPVAAALLGVVALLRDPHQAVRAEESGFDIVLGPVAQTSLSIALLAWFVVSPTNTPMAWAALATVVLTLVKTVVVFQQLDALNSLRAQATTDALTGLGNRRALEDALAAVDAGHPAALVVVDLDRFKAVNDELGHAAGDALLVELAARLRHEADDDDVVVRTGGDEFALLVPGGDASAARDRATRVVAAARRPVHVVGREVRVGASAGVAAAPVHARSASELQEAADRAMYAAKSGAGAGEGGVVVADARVADGSDPAAEERRRGERRTAERRGETPR